MKLCDIFTHLFASNVQRITSICLQLCWQWCCCFACSWSVLRRRAGHCCCQLFSQAANPEKTGSSSPQVAHARQTKTVSTFVQLLLFLLSFLRKFSSGGGLEKYLSQAFEAMSVELDKDPNLIGVEMGFLVAYNILLSMCFGKRWVLIDVIPCIYVCQFDMHLQFKCSQHIQNDIG